MVPETLFDIAPVVPRNVTYDMTSEVLEEFRDDNTKMLLRISTNADKDMAIKLTYNPLIVNVKTGTLLAAMILMIFYALLVWEVSLKV